MRTVVVIGKGPSILRCSAEYISSYDEIAIVNKPVFEGYEEHLPFRADYQFRIHSTHNWAPEEVERMGLKKVVCTHPKSGEEEFDYAVHHGLAEVEYPIYNTGITISPHTGIPHRHIVFNVGEQQFDPSSGIIAFDYMIKSKRFQKIGLVGIDLFELGAKVYYFKKREAQPNIQRLWDQGHYDKEDRIALEAMHDSDLSAQFIITSIEENPDIEFEIISNSTRLTGELERKCSAGLRNVTIL